MRYYHGVGGIYNGKWYVYSGEKRCPKKEEAYLSGAIPQVYIAPNDFITAYHIMKEVPPPPSEIKQNGLTYKLSY